MGLSQLLRSARLWDVVIATADSIVIAKTSGSPPKSVNLTAINNNQSFAEHVSEQRRKPARLIVDFKTSVSGHRYGQDGPKPMARPTATDTTGV